MKARPRHAEREVAKHLSAFFEALGLPPVARIPVLGRTGPDITWNEFKLIVDVKSRKAVPKGVQPPEGSVNRNLDFGWAATRLGSIQALANQTAFGALPAYACVRSWMDHMDAWTRAQVPDGITALVLHRPGMNYKDATLVLKNLEEFHDRLSTYPPLNQY